MSNQHSLIALDWLMPVLQDVFDKLTGLLQQRDNVDLPEVAVSLHQVAGALTLAGQKHLAKLANVLEQATLAIVNEELSPEYQPEIGQSVALLYYELRQLQQIQRMHTAWVIERTNFFNELLGEPPVELSQAELADSTTAMLTALPPASHQLTDEQRQNLQKMWRYYTLQLLTANQNEPESLSKMVEVAKFLTNSTLPDGYRHVWHLVNLWASSQVLNDEPTPHEYHHLLESLDKLIIDDNEPTLLTARVAVDVLLQLSQLANKSEPASALLTPLHLQDNDKIENLFKKSLSKIEKSIYQLHEPEQVIPALQEVKTLLSNRGWLLYESYLEQIIADLQMMVDEPSMMDNLHWQVERQLQDLYTQLLETADTLESKIGTTQFATTSLDSNTQPQQAVLRQTRINLENIKNAFNDYTQSHDSKKLAGEQGRDVNEDFMAMVQVFAMLGLEQPKTLAEQLRLIFAKIVKQPIDILSWQATNVLAQTIAQFELFLDYLSHHNLNTELLEQVQTLIQQANELVSQLASNPLQQADAVNHQTHSHKVFEPNTPIYDDEGEKLATSKPEPVIAPLAVTEQPLIDTQANNDTPVATQIDDFDSFLMDFSDEPMPAQPAVEAVSAYALPETAMTEHALAEKPAHTDTFIDMDAFNSISDNQPNDTAPVDDARMVTGNVLSGISHDFVKDDFDEIKFDNDDFDLTPETNVAEPIASPIANFVKSPIENEEESEALQNARALLKPDADDADEEIREIFIEEAEEVLENLDSELPTWKANPHDLATLKDIRRGFHTLKGSGRMVGAFQLGETAWAVENMLNRVLDGTLEATPELADFIIDTRNKIPTLVQDFANQREPSIDPALIILQANNLLKNRPLLEGMPTAKATTPVAEPAIEESLIEESLPEQPVIEEASEITATKTAETPVEPLAVSVDEVAKGVVHDVVSEDFIIDDESNHANAEDFSADPAEAYTIYEEADEAELATDFQEKADKVDTLADEDTIIFDDEDDVIFDDDDIIFDYEDVRADKLLDDTSADSEVDTPIVDNVVVESPVIENPAEAKADTPIASNSSPTLPDVVQAELDSMVWAEDSESDPDIQEIYIEEAQEVLETIAPQFDVWQKNPSDLATLKEIRRGFHTLKGSGRMVGANQLGELGWSIENMLNRVLDATIEPTVGLVTLVGDVIKGFAPLIDIFAQNRTDYPDCIKVWAATANAYSKKQGDSIDYPHFLQAQSEPSQANAHPVVATVATQAPDVADVETSNPNNEPTTEAVTATTSAPYSETEEAEEELRFEDDPDEDGEDDNYVGQVNTRPTITPDTTVNISDDNGMFADDDDSLDTLSQQPDMLSDEDVIGHVFLEESTQILNKISQFIHDHRHDEQTFVPDELVRAFHTLRGGAALSELPRVYALSAALETSLDDLLRNETPLTQEQIGLLEGAKDDLVRYIGDYKTAQTIDEQPADAEDIAQLTSQLLEASQLLEDGEKPTKALSVTELMNLGIDDLVDGETQVRDEFANAETVADYVQKMHAQAKILLDAVSQSKFAGLANAFVQNYADLVKYPAFTQDAEVVEAFEALHTQLTTALDNIAAGMNIAWNEPVVLYVEKLLAGKKYQAELLAIEYESPHTDVELLDIFLQEATELDQRIHQILTRWQSNLTTNTHMAETRDLRHALHTLKGGARMVGLNSISDLSHAAENIYQAITEQKLASSAEIADIMQQVQDTISTQITLLTNENRSFFAKDLVEQLTAIVANHEIMQGMVLAVPVIVNDKRAENTDGDITPTQVKEDTQQPVVHDEAYAQEIINNFEQRRLDTWHGQEPDEDLLGVYLEEAKELVDSSSQHLQEFRSNTSDIAALQALQRELHTIKGGARMVGAEGLANLSHEMETIYEELGSRRKPATRMIGNLLAACHDWLASALYVLENKYNPQTPQSLIDALLQFSKNPDSLKNIPQASLAQQVEQIEIYQTSLLKAQEDKTRDLSVMPPMSGNFETEQEQSGANAEMIRISSNLMERMINLSGESAINRARIDMGVSSLTNTIEEMGVTVQRLADQLRRMETELEVQILAQIADDRALDTDFDPLEMDQYSALNQLSKSLSESASDLLDIKTTMLDKTRDTENLLLQLSRTQTELQEGLMNSRMVPFSRVTPRLQRIVRQTANELNKSVELRVLNDDSEVDRNILDRITSPLEHMIRNAVDHGVERTQERIESGKSRTGLITLELVREGGEIVIYLTDDGKGINVDAVRKKAIEQGLISADDTSLSPVDIMQYIFNAGLSTSASVTQISGRGVGMDVVQSEVKQLGGVVSVDSDTGKGSRFILRLPLTVAVSDALVVRAGDKQFAVPLVQIERVVRISAETIYAFHDSDATTIDIDGQDYRLRYLNQILYATNPLESVRHQTASVPVIIIRNETGQRMALQVDAIAGSRVEVVVKPLGRQLSHIAGISSATIMGDGSVMLILDLIALMRNAVNAVKADKAKSVTNVAKPVVLIIDDSVTVRKVTSRLLERNGFEPQIAKDGVDALEVLQSLTPDIMLLDIEMPRMDGFEVANQVRHTERLKDVPIIMITSRTGEKHRERAMSIGVNQYMGKPFQEQDLLENITRLLNEKAVN